MKGTFFAEYLNAAFIFGVVLVFVTSIYFLNPELGGVEGMYEKLTNAATLRPVAGNSEGVYLTMASTGALMFGIINIVGNFGTIFVDQAYWQKAIAARPRSAVKGFLTGGLAWFAIPFALATTLGLAAVATNVSLTPEENRERTCRTDSRVADLGRCWSDITFVSTIHRSNDRGFS